MKFSINKSSLQSVLSVASKGVSSHSVLPILSGILIRAEGESVVFEATDLNLSIRCTAPALIEEEGNAVLPSRLFSDIVKNLPDAAIFVQAGVESAEITCDNASLSMKTLDPQDFPGFPEVQEQTSIKLSYQTFSAMVKKVAKVVSRDESRAILTGVLMQVEGDVLRMVATDSYRLAIVEEPFEGATGGFSAVIPGNFMMEVASLSQTPEDIQIALSENQIIMRYGNTTFVNRKLEGNFPNYQGLLPSSYATKAVFATDRLVDAIKRTSLLSNRTSPVRIDLNAASQTALFSTQTQDIGSAQETLACAIEGEDVTIGFNFTYVLEGLASVNTEKVSLELQEAGRPGIFRADTGENYLYLIMPVRL